MLTIDTKTDPLAIFDIDGIFLFTGSFALKELHICKTGSDFYLSFGLKLYDSNKEQISERQRSTLKNNFNLQKRTIPNKINKLTCSKLFSIAFLLDKIGLQKEYYMFIHDYKSSSPCINKDDEIINKYVNRGSLNSAVNEPTIILTEAAKKVLINKI